MKLLIIVALVALETTAVAQPSAEDLYAEGQAAYDRTDYATAIARWQASYDLSGETALLFNLAQAKRLSGDCPGALATYRQFTAAAAADSTSEQHKLAEDLTRELERKCPEQKPAAVPQPVAVHTDHTDAPRSAERRSEAGSAQPGRVWKIAGISTGGVGVVTLAIGLGLGYRGTSIGDEITSACRTNCDWEALQDKDARGRRYVEVGRVLDAIGVAAIASGAIFYYLGVRQEAITVAPTQRDGGAVVSWSGSW